MKVTFRDATISDLELLEYWDTQQHVIDSDPDEDWNWAEELPKRYDWREMLVAQINNEPIGFVQIIDPYLEETHYWGDVPQHLRAIDIWIGEEKHLNLGYGTQMMHLAIERCFTDQRVEKILIDPLKSNTKAHRFYERLGFEFVEERTFEGTPCYVYQLERSKL